MKKRILVADDDTDIRELVCVVISDIGHHCEITSGGEAALQAFASARNTPEAFHLVILDLAMPYTNGFAVAEKIRHTGDETTPILFMTGYGESVEDRAREFTDLPVLAKPFGARQLRARIVELMGTP